MRATFTLPPKPERFEKILLSLFEPGCRAQLPEKYHIEAALKTSHARLLDAFWKGGGPNGSRKFSEIANYADKTHIPIADISYVTLLYQILWHELAQRGKTTDAAGYRCDARPQTFGGEGEFLNMLLKAIYARSFDGHA